MIVVLFSLVPPQHTSETSYCCNLDPHLLGLMLVSKCPGSSSAPPPEMKHTRAETKPLQPRRFWGYFRSPSLMMVPGCHLITPCQEVLQEAADEFIFYA